HAQHRGVDGERSGDARDDQKGGNPDDGVNQRHVHRISDPEQRRADYAHYQAPQRLRVYGADRYDGSARRNDKRKERKDESASHKEELAPNPLAPPRIMVWMTRLDGSGPRSHGPYGQVGWYGVEHIRRLRKYHLECGFRRRGWGCGEMFDSAVNSA